MPLTHEEKAWDEFWKSAKETGVVNMLPIKLARSAFAAGYEAAQQSVQRIGGTCLHKNIDPDACVCLDCGENRPVPANR